MFDAKHYVSLIGKLVLETAIHFGFMNTYSPDEVEVGPFERFQVGGDGLAGQNFILGTDIIGLRGYPNLSIKPDEQYTVTSHTCRFEKVFLQHQDHDWQS